MTTFHYRGGRYIERLTVNTNDTEKYPTMEPYRIDLDSESLSLDAATASTLALSLIEALFDRDDLDMPTADRLGYLSMVVLSDREMPRSPHIDHTVIADGWAAVPVEEV